MAEKLAAIRTKAEALLGKSLGESGDLLTEMAAQRACAYCNRTDIPPEMEQAVAALLCAMAGEGDVKSVTRGDTAVTYFGGTAQGALHALQPFCRLGTVEKREGCEAK